MPYFTYRGYVEEDLEQPVQNPGESAANSEPASSVCNDAATEVLQSVAVDSVQERLTRWAEEASASPGAQGLRDLDTLQNLLDLTGAHPAGIAQLYGGRLTKLSSLLRDGAVLGAARAVMRKLDAEKKSSVARSGLYPTNLVIGVANWTQLPPFKESERGSRPELSHFKLEKFNLPVLMRPLELEAIDGDYTLKMGGSVVINPVLVKAFRDRHIDCNPEAIIAASLEDGRLNVTPALEAIRRAGQDFIPGFDLKENLLVANLGVSSAVLSSDWDAILPMAGKNPLVRAFAGDKSAAAELLEPLPETSPADRDPDLERGIGDLDVSQARVVELIASGRSIFVDVPPGAPGASTVQAFLADCGASGKHVCYVPGGRRIGRVTVDGMQKAGLGNFVLDLTGASEWLSGLRDQLLNEDTAYPQPPVPVTELGDAHERLRQTRDKLSAYTQRLHVVREPWGVSAYAALQALADLTSAQPGPRTKVKLELADDEHSSKEGRERARELLTRAQDAGLLEPELQESPWKGVVLSTESDAQDAIEKIHALADGRLETLHQELERVSEETGLVLPSTLNAWKEQLGMLEGVARSLDIFQPEIFAHSAADMVIATASRKWRQERSLPMKGKDKRNLIKQAKDALRPGAAPQDLHAELVRVQSFRDLWRRHALPGAWPRIPQEFEAVRELSAQVFAEVVALAPILSQVTTPEGTKPEEVPLSDLLNLVKSLDKTTDQALRLPRQVQLLKELKESGLGPLLDDLRARRVPADLALAELDLAWWSAILLKILQSDSVLAGIDGAAMHELADTLRSLDLAQIESLPYPVSRAMHELANQARQAQASTAEALQSVLECGDTAALSDFQSFAPLIRQLRPVWALSPYLLAQIYGSSTIEVLVLDHLDFMSLSQVIPLIARAKQLVVLGDSRRGWTGFTQLAAKVLPVVSLRCDLGELSEQVALFLASHGYGASVSPVPSPRPASLVKLHVISDSESHLARDGSPVISRGEISRVVELILDHALNRASQSLAVVCLNPRGVTRIRSALNDALVKVPQAQDFFHKGSGREPFVIVDSAAATGLRRDVVIMSLGMSKTPHGRVQLNFGPVSGPSGVAHVVGCLEVVRQRLEIVSAFRANEVDLSKISEPGARMLVDLLDSADNPEGMERALTTPESFESEPDRLLVDLAERLWRAGLTVVPRFGFKDGIQIPLAIGSAELPSELLVAVLTDDDTYVREPSLRRRERLWPARLEAAGWKVITCYTMEVFANPAAQAAKVRHAVETALASRKDALSVPLIAAPQIEVPEESSRPKTVLNSTESPAAESVAPRNSEETPAEDNVKSLPEDRESEEKNPAAPNLRVVGAVRGPRPPVAKGLPLAAYGDDQLDELLEWIQSDGVNRSEDQQVNELRETLELSRRGAQVDAVLRHVVRRRNAAL